MGLLRFADDIALLAERVDQQRILNTKDRRGQYNKHLSVHNITKILSADKKLRKN